MIRAMMWKELREQGVIAVTLVVLGGAVLFVAATFGEPPAQSPSATDVVRALGTGRLAALMLVVTAGTVCGGALFAAEREAGTMAFLDALPVSRWHVWRAKAVAGLALVVVQIVVLLAIAAALNVADMSFARRLAVYALMAFAWGVLGSTLARTTLGSVGIAIPAASLASFVFLLPVYLFLTQPGTSVPRPVGWIAFQVLMLLTPLAVSAWQFTARDRERAIERDAPDAVMVSGTTARLLQRGKAGLGLRAVTWLSLRQLRVTAAVLSAFAFGFGLALLLPEARAVFVWPPLALAAGALAGVTMFGGEQARGTGRFWGEQRLPVGRAWWVKVGIHLLLTLWLLILLTLPSAIRAQGELTGRFGHGRSIFSTVFRSRLFDELGTQSWKYLLVPAAYGFAFGHLCGLLFRKPVVATGVAMLVGGTVAALWLPSLLAGGVTHWQVWLPAAIVLLTGRLLVRAWAAERPAARGPLLRLVGGGSLAFLLLAVGVGYRVVEVPDEPGGEDDLAFVASLPTYDQNLTGREFRAAAERYARVAAVANQSPGAQATLRLEERLDSVLRTGWPPSDSEALVRWLDAVFADKAMTTDETAWPKQAADAAAPNRPIGIYDPPQLVGTPASSAVAADNARRMGVALLVRGLQEQERDPTAFPRRFATVIALARAMRNGGGSLLLLVGLDLERCAHLAADRWLERLDNAAVAPLQALGRIAAAADDVTPFDPRLHALADRYVVREMMKAPAQWMAVRLTPHGWLPEQLAAEADLIAFAWTVPWEKERTRRLIGLGLESGQSRERFTTLAGRPGASLLVNRSRTADDLADAARYVCAIRRALVLKCAVRRYQAERGEQPARVEELVERGYLRAVPEDPYARGRPFQYERATVERKLYRPKSPNPSVAYPAGNVPRPSPNDLPDFVTVQPGQARVWCVGADGIDDGGIEAPGGPHGKDIVFVVPLPVKP